MKLNLKRNEVKKSSEQQMLVMKSQIFLLVSLRREGSVIVNFTVFYAEVKQGEILYLQDYIATTGKMYNLSTIVKDVTPVRGW